MNTDDMTFLEKSLINSNNKNISKLTFNDIDNEKQKIIKELNLTKKDTKDLLSRLKDYQYID